MGAESHKARPRLESLLEGVGLDIGCSSTPINDTCDKWDWEQGDAQYMVGAPPDHYDYIVSSHLLEHLPNPVAALRTWWKLLKVGGALILLVPDEDLYEQGYWPSLYNGDHKHTFTLHKDVSWSPASLNVLDIIQSLPNHKLIDLTIQDKGYDYDAPIGDQTGAGAEASIQVIVRKLPELVPAPVQQNLNIETHITYV